MLRPAVLAWTVLIILVIGIGTVAYEQFFALPRNAPGIREGMPTTVAGGRLPVHRAEAPRPVPDLRFIDGDARPRSLAEFRGRVVLLNIWATWCVPCRQEMPALDRLQARLGGPDFEVVALSIDRDGLPKVTRFYEELGLEALRIYVATDSDLMAKLGAVGVPLTLLVDRNGMERWRRLGPAEWDQPEIVDLIRKEVGEGTQRP
jgi:thiol-disulfide isomerase/thioredoxin